jgi:FkbM family methyltransferase
MRTFAETLARPLSIVRELFHQQGTALTGRNLARDEHAEAAVYGPDLAGAMTQRTPIPATYAKTATHEDIFYCFRLLLGRNPNPEEWPGHSSRVGEDLENVVSSYLTSREFTARNLMNKTYRDQVGLVRLPRFSLFASNDDLAVGHHIHGGSYEPGVTAVLMRYVKPGMSVIDIGANIGYFTMLSASLVEPAGLVVAVEPNPENIKLMEATRRVNGFGQVLIIQAAAGRHTGLLSLNVSYSNGTTGELSDDPNAIFASQPVPCFALDGLLPNDRPINLVKIDIEGAELNALIGLSQTLDRDHPVIVSEFSPGALPGISRCTGPEFLRFLIGKGYRIGAIEQDGSEQRFSDDVDGVMGAYSRSGIDHIDIVATRM